MTIPEKPSVNGLDDKWAQNWADTGVYRFVPAAVREQVYSIDTPPPTVSGSLHVGHVFSYTHTDIVARYRRMRGKQVFYPMGWDDNGLPTERRVQNYYGVRCEPTLPYDPEFTAPEQVTKKGQPPVALSRRNFVELCEKLTGEDERVFEHLWRRLGLSVDWSMTYTTIGAKAQRVSQTAFLRLLARGEAYQSEAPTMWDVDFRTAVSNAEMVDKDQPAAYHRLRFTVEGAPVHIETTRPELLPACVALVAHPDDERYQPLFGKEALTPLFGVRVPVLAHPAAQADKGSGIAMVCTFGDQTDVIWWRELGLATRTIIGRDGRLQELDFAEIPCQDPQAAAEVYAGLVGRGAAQARKAIVELLEQAGVLEGTPRAITHPVKFYEKGDRPLEIVSSRQWFVRTLAGKEDLLARGAQITWQPPHMKSRFDDWVRNLNADWLISRQRYFGVPFPLWYPLDAAGEPDYAHPILPDESELPVDPQSAAPAGYTEAQRGVPGGFGGEPDVMDTWATSSLTPQLACGWLTDPDLYAVTYPMDLRPQAHDIIRTWLFSTVVRSHLEEDATPWRHAAISGWILDPDRKKMSKSQGNVITPEHLIDEHGADGVRYWAALGRPGTDTAFEPQQMKVGRRLATKMLNAAKFVYSFGEPSADAQATDPLDRALLAVFADTVAEATAALEGYEYTTALVAAERFFWMFCDDYVELVKDRAYAGSDSARLTLRRALNGVVQLLAPFIPFTTEEVWSWTHEGSVHVTAWPEASAYAAADAADSAGAAAGLGSSRLLGLASALIGAVRRAKTAEKLSMRADIATVVVTCPPEQAEAIRGFEQDVRAAGHIGRIVYEVGDTLDVKVVLED
ncbi:valine--tRNA ligase [Actinospica durhamensis]|uniref:Valine--tRNA ligase n=1 Tax=Actinospica durhamensis TaxID=1508375 RepID=A0A941EVB5_9ACTN|nr:valine--tRNA ligase [Actinospica durhamensis]MBR7838420.1 valine--tRNA ligase [Actinospica durhamensis]